MYLFMVSSLLPGLAAGLGSIVGHAPGQAGLWVGGIVGGVLGALAAAFASNSFGWIQRNQLRAVSIGSCVGFLAAALIAVNTLSSPIGPIASTTLAGLGAIAGARFARISRNAS